jgi:hypothetical protein
LINAVPKRTLALPPDKEHAVPEAASIQSAHPDGEWPELPLASWRDTYATLHMWTQIVGKTRLALAPMENHWWQVAMYVNDRGLTTSPMPWRGEVLVVEFDFIGHELVLRTSTGEARRLALAPMSVAAFYAAYTDALASLGVMPELMPTLVPKPVEVDPAIPFAQDMAHASYDAAAANRWWRALLQVDRVFKLFRSGFIGKQSPAHFFWGSFDHACTRFSGRAAPRHPGGAPNCPDRVMVEAYSHECSSAGFWPGGGAIEAPAFYAYAYPEPPGYGEHRVQPSAAFYDSRAREFILPYDAVAKADAPDLELLAFLQSTYGAAAGLGRWDRAALERGDEG